MGDIDNDYGNGYKGDDRPSAVQGVVIPRCVVCGCDGSNMECGEESDDCALELVLVCPCCVGKQPGEAVKAIFNKFANPFGVSI